MKSKNSLWLVVLATLIFQGMVLTTAHATTISSHRLSGDNRYETSSVISQKGWTTADTVILVSGENFADVLSAGPLAKKYNSPILLTTPTNVNDEILSEIDRLKAKNIIIVGGTGAVSVQVETALKVKGYNNISRIAGVNRYETSALVADKLDKQTSVIIAPGENFPDALSISSVASKLGIPILLSSKNGLSDYAKNYIKNNGITKSYIVGGEGALAATVEQQVPNPKRLAGADRFETNVAIMKEFEANLSFDNLYLATGNNFADALSGTALAASTGSPIILTTQTIDENTNNYLKGKINVNTKAIALGGENIVPDSIVQKVTDDKAEISVAKTYSNQGSFSDGTINGDTVIRTSGVFLKNTTIKGDLLVASTVGEGTVDLDNVTVSGKIIINGGGENSVDLHNMEPEAVELDKAIGKKVRIATDVTSSIKSLVVNSDGIVDETTSAHIGNVTVNQPSEVEFRGDFDTIDVITARARMNLLRGNINILNFSSLATGSRINMAAGTIVKILNALAAVAVTGTGIITTANVGVNGTTIETKPTNLVPAAGVTVSIANEGNTEVVTPPVAQPSTGGGSSSHSQPSVTLNSIAITTPASKLIYTVGDVIDLTGLVVTATYSDGSKVIKPVSAANITGFDSSKSVASELLTITIDGKTTSYSIAVKIVTSQPTIGVENVTVTSDAATGKLIIQGNISSGIGKEVTMELLDPDGTLDYADQSTSVEAGKFTFTFNASFVNSGNYTVKLGGEGISIPYEQKFAFSGIVDTSVTIGNVTINTDSATSKITIQGNISTGLGKEVTLQVLNPDGTLDYLGQATSIETGKFTFILNANAVLSGNYTVKLGGHGITTPVKLNFGF